MIRLNKPVKLLEWGLGTNTMNQRWEEFAQGQIVSAKRKDGITEVIVDVKGSFNKKNLQDDVVKVAQLGEGMAPFAERWGKVADRWGEVAMGKLKTVENIANKSRLYIEVNAATKVGQARS